MRAIVFAALAIGIAGPALAQTARAYEYDVHGRLIKVTTDGGATVVYSYDVADNRTAVVASPPTNPSPPSAKVVVVPLLGFLVIPIQQAGS
jgi:YD repeat-containing protein